MLTHERSIEQVGLMEVVMPVDFQHTFPLSHENALWCLHHAPWNQETKQQLYNISTLESLHRPLGDHLKRVWYLADRSYPLPRHYMKRFGLGSPDDMICLVIQHFLCQLRQEEFHLARFVAEFQRFWRDKGKDPVTLQDIPRGFYGF
jgi:hypothetical protein